MTILPKLETLRGAMKDLIEDARREKVREEELRGLSGYNGRPNAPPAYAAGIEVNDNNNAPPGNDTPAPNGGASRRGRSRARGTQRSASPGVRSNTSTPGSYIKISFYFGVSPPISYFRRGKTEIGRRGEIRN